MTDGLQLVWSVALIFGQISAGPDISASRLMYDRNYKKAVSEKVYLMQTPKWPILANQRWKWAILGLVSRDTSLSQPFWVILRLMGVSTGPEISDFRLGKRDSRKAVAETVRVILASKWSINFPFWNGPFCALHHMICLCQWAFLTHFGPFDL